MRNYSKELKEKLTEKQRDFIKKVQKRYFKTLKVKKSLYSYWDNLSNKIDGKVFKSVKQFENIKHSVLSCGSYLEFYFPKNTDLGKLQRANFCKKDKLCISCAVGRAYNQQKKFLQSLEVLKSSGQDLCKKHWYYIVTPVRHYVDESLEVVFERVSKLRQSALMQMRNSRRRNTAGFWSRFKGGMGSVEFTYTQNGWNVHINWLVYSDNRLHYYKVADGKKFWYQNKELEDFLSRFNDSYIHSINELNFSSSDVIRKNLLEILKYALKFSSLSPEQLVEVYYKLYRKRLFFTFGSLRALDLESVKDVSIGDDIEDFEKFYRVIMGRVERNEKYNYECEYFEEVDEIK